MSVLIVGGDHLGSIPKELKKIGVDDIKHMSGRNRSHSFTRVLAGLQEKEKYL